MSEVKKIRVILLEPGEMAKTAEIDDALESLQSVVGGSIEIVYPFEDAVCLICNEEGKLIGLKPNRALYDAGHEMIDVLCGAVIICGIGEEGSLNSLSDEMLEKYTEMYRFPQMFFRTGGGITAINYNPKQ